MGGTYRPDQRQKKSSSTELRSILTYWRIPRLQSYRRRLMQPLISRGVLVPRPYICHACRSALPRRSPLQRARPFSQTSPELQETTSRRTKQTNRSRRLKQKQGRSEDVGSSAAFQTSGAEEEPALRQYGYDPAAELKGRIDKLEEELREMRTGGLLGNKELLAELSDADRKKVVDTLKAKRSEEGRSRQVAEEKQQAAATTVNIVAPKEQRIYLNRMNGYLKQAQRGLRDQKNRQQLWRWYMLCKQSVPAFIFRVPKDAWDVLWETLAIVSPSNPDRSSHLKTLAGDIISLGRELTARQRIEYIEALFLNGQRDAAIDEWKASQDALGAAKGLWQQYWRLGIRLFAAHKDPAQAQETARVFLDEKGGKDVRILLPVIKAWIGTGDLEGFTHAWAVYLRLRDGLGSNLTMDDYDSVTQSFLQAGRADLALGVFKDMMLTGDPQSDHVSSKIYKKAVGTVSDMQDMSLSAPDTHQISLEAMTVLPRRFQNKYFYGSWIKKLLGAQEADSAAAVVGLMYERGVRPDPKHLNGIIGSWIRSKKAQAYEKAEKMAWEMIEERKKFAFERRQQTRGEEAHVEPDKVQIRDGRYSAKYKPTSAPPATIETFCLMIEYYLRRNNTDQIRWLNRSLRLAEIPPNTSFMNNLLQSQLKSGGLRDVWDTYSVWKKAHTSAEPDFETYEFLWKCEKTRLDKSPREWLQSSPTAAGASISSGSKADGPNHGSDADSSESSALSFEERRALVRTASGFPSPRSLFAAMNEWISSLSPSQLDTYATDFSKATYENIVECFIRDNDDGSTGGDLAGALVAMHALKSDFGMYPDEATARLIILQVSRNTGAASDSGTTGTGLSPRRREGRYNIRKISALLEELAERRSRFLQEHQQPQHPGSKSSAQAKRRTTVLDMLENDKQKSLFDEDDEDEDEEEGSGRNRDGAHLDETLKKEENLYLVSELLRTVLSRRLRTGGLDLDTVVQRAAWDMGVGGIHTGDHLA